MERICFSTLWISVWIIFALDIYLIESADIDLPTRLGVIGPNRVTLACRYSLSSGEQFASAKWSRKRNHEQSFTEIVKGLLNGQAVFTPDGSNLGSRTNISLSLTQSLFTITFNDVECSDEAKYKCFMSYTSGGVINQVEKEMDFKLEAAPLKPSQMELNPNKEMFIEYEEVEFSCTANVGKPGGTIWWFVYHGTVEKNVTDSAELGTLFPSTPPNVCTFVRRSSLKLNLTRQDNGLVVRCQVYHPTQMSQRNLLSCDSDTDLCRQTQRLAIHYPVRQTDLTVHTEPRGPDFLVQRMVTLKCSVMSNPPAAYVWQKRDSNTTFTGPVWTINNLHIGDAGVYDCTATNNVSGTIYNVTAGVNVNVVETTTTATTTPATSSTTSQSDGRTDKTQALPGDNTTTIIIAVCVAIGVIIIIAAVVMFFFIRHRKKNAEVEEPPEKPFNNHSNLSMYNTQPDLVSDEKKYSHNNSFDYKPDRDQDLAYADLKFDDVPRSRKPVALRENIDYAHVSMPSV